MNMLQPPVGFVPLTLISRTVRVPYIAFRPWLVPPAQLT